MRKSLQNILLLIFTLVFAVSCSKESFSAKHTSSEYSLKTYLGQDASALDLASIGKTVEDDYQYFGLSTYLGSVIPVSISETGKASKVKFHKSEPTLVTAEWVGFRGRFETVLVRAPGASIYIQDQGVRIEWEAVEHPKLELFQGQQDAFQILSEGLPQINSMQYIHLPKPLQYLSKVMEGLYRMTAGLPFLGYGLALFLFGFLVKIIMLPISSRTKAYQLTVNAHRSYLEPIHADIKKNLSGEKAHKALMKSYKDRGITPYYTLKPLFVTLLGLPILIAIFNMLGELHILKNSAFLWISSLAYPDHLTTLPFNIPFFGNRLNILPFVMTAVTIVSAHVLKDKNSSLKEQKRQRRNMYFMSAFFFLLFYNFPSGMILYWTIASSLAVLFSRSSFKKSV